MAKTPASRSAPRRLMNALERGFAGLETASGYLRNLIINFAFLAAFVAIVPLVVVEMVRDRVTIEPIGVPEEVAALGLSSDVAANRLWDALQEVYAAANSDKERLAVLPASRRVEFAFPDSGISFESLIYHVRRFFGFHDTRIAGELVCPQSPCTRETLQLRLRVIREGMELIELPPLGTQAERLYFMTGAAEVLRHLDPFTAAAYLLTTDPEHALASLRKIVKSNHKDAKWALNLIGLAQEKQGRSAQAEESFKAALAIDPEHLPPLVNLARLQSETGRPAAAITTASKAIAINPGYARAYLVRGLAQAALNRPEAALADFHKAADAEPDSAWPQWRIGYFLFNRGDNAGAKAAYQAALETDPDFHEARIGLASVALETGDTRELLLQYREMARTKPGDASAIADVAGALALDHQYAQAIETYREALRLKPGVADWLGKLGQLLRDAGDHAGAVAVLKEALAAGPDLADPWFDLGETYRRMGSKAEAKAAFETFIGKAPDSPFAVLARSYLAALAG